MPMTNANIYRTPGYINPSVPMGYTGVRMNTQAPTQSNIPSIGYAPI